MIDKDLGAVSAYAIAVEHGYTGTEEEFIEEITNAAKNAQSAKESAQTAASKASAAAQSAEDAQTAEEATQEIAEQAITDIGEAKSAAIVDVNSAKDAAVETVNSAKTAAVDAVDEARADGVKAVNEQTESGEQAIASAATAAKDSVTAEGTKQVGLVADEGTKQVKAVNDAGAAQLDAITKEGAAQKQAVTDEGTKQVKAVTDEGTKQVGLVSDEGTKQTKAVTDEGTKQVGLVTDEGTKQTKAVTDEGTKQVGLVTDEGTAQKQAVADKGAEVLASIPEDYTALTKEVANHDARISNLEQTEKKYGFRRKKSESSPSARIEYLFDAADMTPAYMDFENDKFEWGDWKAFVESFIRPVMLKDDGTVDYELDHDDQTKKVNGDASDISNTAYAGSAMVEFGRKFCWVKRYQENGYEYVIFANRQIDDDYHAYAHTGSDGEIKDAFYWGMFTGMNLSSKLRSLVGAPMVSQTRETEIKYAKNIGDGWHTIYWSAWNYINDLLTLISKNDNSQAAYGAGRTLSSNTSKINNGTLADKGCFYGDNGGVNGVKTLWIENHWGNIWQGMAGCINDNGTCKIKNFKPYCDTPVSAADYSEYTEVGTLPASGFQKDNTESENGSVPLTTGGSETTYFADYFWNNAAQVDYALVGAYWNDAGQAGARALYLNNLASYASSYVGSRPSYIP